MSELSKIIRRSLSQKDPSSYIQIGDVFGNLEVLGIGEKKGTSRHIHYDCRCLLCGKIITVPSYRLKSGVTKSCGCSKFKHGHALRIFGGRSHEYSVWVDMKKRCYEPKAKGYHRYGGRGIYVCDRWLGEDGFPNFIEDMGLCPDGYQLDRINNDGPYAPDNCRWASIHDQARNTRANVWIEYEGERMILQDWADRFGVDGTFISKRLKKGLSMAEVVNLIHLRNKGGKK